MTKGPRTVVDTIHISQGANETEASSLTVAEISPVLARSGHGNLYVLLETVGGFPDHQGIQQNLVSVVQDSYQAPGNPSANVRDALNKANIWLFEHNVAAPREERGIAGMTVLVIKGQDAYIGQIGPSLLYHVREGITTRYPEESSWLTSSQLQDVDIKQSPPLGLRREVESTVSHIGVGEGDQFVLCSTILVTYGTDEQIVSAVSDRGAHCVHDRLEALANGRDLSAVAVEVAGEGALSAARAGEPRPRAWDRVSEGLRQPPLPVPAAKAVSDDDEPEEGEFEEQLPSLDWRSLTRALGQAIGKVARWVGSIFSHMLPESTGRRPQKPSASRTARTGSAAPDRRLMWLALGIPVVVAGIYLFTRYQYEQSRLEQFRKLLGAAQQAKAAAEAENVVTEKRAKLMLAIKNYDEAIKIRPTDTTALTEQKTLQDLLDGVNQVHYLSWNELRDYTAPEDPRCKPATLVVQGLDVFAFDPGTGRVFRSLLNQSRTAIQDAATEQPLLRRGEQKGDFVATDLLDITWAEAGGARGRSNLLVLNRRTQLLEFDPWVGLKSLPVSTAASWQHATLVSSYNGNLYVLDPNAGRLLKYEPTASGYDSPPKDYFTSGVTATLTGAVDMAIDGNLYLLHGNGAIAKYLGGQTVPFTQTISNGTLLTPTALCATGSLDESGSLYVADAGNQRVVQLNKRGEFVRQFKSRSSGPLADLRSLYVDETLGRLYVASGCKLYWAAME